MLVVLAASALHSQFGRIGWFYSARFYDGEVVAANDIGAIDYLARPRIVDLCGLASNDLPRQRLAGTYTTEVIRELAREHSVRVVVVYADWFTGRSD